jgi:hypothetical protein
MKDEHEKYNKDLIFIRIYRYIVDDYLIHKKITLDEFIVLLWLILNANPHNGLVNTSYIATSVELSSRYTKNEINKICLSLKVKKYIHFKNQQGRRSSFNIEIHNYPLANGTFKNVYGSVLSDPSRSDNTLSTPIVAEVTPEAERTLQKLKGIKDGDNQQDSSIQSKPLSRSTNNNKDIYKNNSLRIADKYAIPVDDFQTQDDDDDFCKDIALDFEDENMSFVLSLRDRYGIGEIRKAYKSMEWFSSGGEHGLNNPKAYLLSILKKNNPP